MTLSTQTYTIAGKSRTHTYATVIISLWQQLYAASTWNCTWCSCSMMRMIRRTCQSAAIVQKLQFRQVERCSSALRRSCRAAAGNSSRQLHATWRRRVRCCANLCQPCLRSVLLKATLIAQIPISGTVVGVYSASSRLSAAFDGWLSAVHSAQASPSELRRR